MPTKKTAKKAPKKKSKGANTKEAKTRVGKKRTKHMPRVHSFAPTSPIGLTAATRRDLVLDLRMRSWSQGRIAKYLGISQPRVSQILMEALEEIEQSTEHKLEPVRNDLSDKLHRQIEVLWPQAMGYVELDDGTHEPRPINLAAHERIDKAIDRLARIHGVYAAVKVQAETNNTNHTTHDVSGLSSETADYIRQRILGLPPPEGT